MLVDRLADLLLSDMMMVGDHLKESGHALVPRLSVFGDRMSGGCTGSAVPVGIPDRKVLRFLRVIAEVLVLAGVGQVKRTYTVCRRKMIMS